MLRAVALGRAFEGVRTSGVGLDRRARDLLRGLDDPIRRAGLGLRRGGLGGGQLLTLQRGREGLDVLRPDQPVRRMLPF
jgi:hypothetical protein